MVCRIVQDMVQEMRWPGWGPVGGAWIWFDREEMARVSKG